MLEQGFIDEVLALRNRSDLHAGLPSIRAVGYRQIWDYLDGKLTQAEMQERGIIATRQLAKRSSPGCAAGMTCIGLTAWPATICHEP
jgi:tRNA dimethylallyltransferase